VRCRGATIQAQTHRFTEGAFRMYERRGGSVFGAFLLGGLVGAVLGLLFAPRTGEETREMLTDKANEYWGQAGEMYSTGIDKVGEAVDSGKDTRARRASSCAPRSTRLARVSRSRLPSPPTPPRTSSTTSHRSSRTRRQGREGTKVRRRLSRTVRRARALDFVAKKAAGGIRRCRRRWQGKPRTRLTRPCRALPEV